MFYGQECDLCEEAHCPLLSWLCPRVLPRVLGPEEGSHQSAVKVDRECNVHEIQCWHWVLFCCRMGRRGLHKFPFWHWASSASAAVGWVQHKLQEEDGSCCRRATSAGCLQELQDNQWRLRLPRAGEQEEDAEPGAERCAAGRPTNLDQPS